MTTSMKGIYKGIKFISHLFVVKERELEIGLPTDVKHVAHIGLEGHDGSAPSWMNEFKNSPDYGISSSVGSVGGSIGGSRDPTWTSQDFDQSLGRQQQSDLLANFPPTNLPSIPKNKTKRKKGKTSSSSSRSTSSPRSSSARSSRASRRSTRREMEDAETMEK